MKAFNFDLQRFDAVYEFTTGFKTFKDSALVHYTEMDPAINYNVKTNCKSLTIGYNIGVDYNTGETFISSYITISGENRVLRGNDLVNGDEVPHVQMYCDTELSSKVWNDGSYVTIYGGNGNDYVDCYHAETSVEVYLGTGNDKVDNSAMSSTIEGGNGDDTINNLHGDNTKIFGGDDADSILNNGSDNVTIDGGSGDDFINNYNGKLFLFEDSAHTNKGTKVSISSGSGDDHIRNCGDAVTIDGGLDNDYVINVGEYVSIKTGFDSDTIENYARYVTVDSGDAYDYYAQDSIVNYAANVTIEAGASNDIIENSGRASSINAGGGDDTIRLYANIPIAKALNDVLEPIKKAAQDAGLNIPDMWNFLIDKLDALNETDLSALKVDSPNPNYTGKILKEVEDKFSQIETDAGAFADALDKAEELLEKAGTSSKTITQLKNVFGHVNKLAGKMNKIFSSLEILGGMISDYRQNKIFPMLKEALLKNFDRNDNGRVSFAWGTPAPESTTVCGGKGDDKFYNDEFAFHVYEYHAGDGNDVIYNWNSNDTLKIIGDKYTGTVEGNDYVVRVGSGSITFKDYKLRRRQQIQTGEHLPCWIEGYNETSVTQPTPTQPTSIEELAPPKGITVDEETLTAAKGFSGTIDPSEGYAPNVTQIDASKAKAVEVVGSNAVHRVTLSGGDDTIYNWNDSVSVNAGGGNDLIYNFGDDTTLIGGTGNDIIFSAGDNVLFQYTSGEGNDAIVGFNETSTLSIASGTYSTAVSGADIIVTVGKGKITLSGAANVATIHINDKMIVPEKQFYIDGTEKADSISNTLGGMTINALGGNDTIYNNAVNVTIYGGAGNDKIFSLSENNTIAGGAGNDSISLSSDAKNNLIVYNAGDGSDVIQGFNANSTLSIAGSSYLKTVSGKDIIVTVGEGKITLKDAASLSAVNIAGTKGIATGISVTNNTVKVSTAFTGKRIDLADFDGATAVDASAFAKGLTIIGTELANTITGSTKNDTLTGGNGGANTFIMSGGKDVITDYTSGKDKISVDGAANVSINKSGDAVITVGKNTLTLKKDASENPISDGKQITFIDGKGTTTKTYFNGYVASGESVTLNSTFKGSFETSSFTNVDGSSVKASIKINGGTKNETLAGGAGNDTLNGGSGQNLLTGGAGKDIFIYGGGNDTITDYDPADKISLGSAQVQSFSVTGNNVTFSLGDSKSLTLNDAAGKKVTFAEGKKSSVNIYTTEGLLNSAATAVTLDASTKTFTADSKLVTIDGSNTSGVAITGNAKTNLLIGGNGSDTFVYTAGDGNEVIGSYGTGDKISIVGATVTDASINKSGHTVLKVGKNSVTVKDSKEVTLVDDGGEKIFSNGVFYNTGKTQATLPVSFSAKGTTQFDTPQIINASLVSKAVNLSGNDAANSIAGSAKNDTLAGGKGNDTLTGGKGSDVFLYTSGKDVIVDYASGDKISVGGLSFEDFALNGKDVILQFGSDNTLTLVDAKDQAINLNSVVKVYSAEGIFNSKTTALTLATATSRFDATDYSTLVTIDGARTTSLELVGNAKANKLIAGASNSTLNGGTGNDTLVGGDGADVFVYENKSGNKTIVGYGTGDRISLGASVTIDNVTSKKGDTIVKVGSNNITVKNASELTFVQGGVETLLSGGVFTSAESLTATLPATFAKSFDLGKYKNADSSKRSAAIQINGNALENTILGGAGNDTLYGGNGADNLLGGKGADRLYGDAGNDTLTGGAGNDSLWGGDGADTFLYNEGDGKDVIVGFDTDDMLQITGDWTAAYSTKTKAVSFKVGSTASALTLKDFTATTFTVNNETYQISDNKFVKK